MVVCMNCWSWSTFIHVSDCHLFSYCHKTQRTVHPQTGGFWHPSKPDETNKTQKPGETWTSVHSITLTVSQRFLFLKLTRQCPRAILLPQLTSDAFPSGKSVQKKKISYFMMEWIVEKVSFGRICSYRDLWHSLRDRWSYLRGFEGLRGLHIVMRVFVMFSQIVWLRFWRLWWCSAEQRPGFPAPPAQRHHVKSINKTRGNKAAGKWSLCGHPLPSMRHVWPLHPFIIDVARITGTAHTVKYSPAAPLLEKKGKKMGECHKTNCITL